MTSIPAESARSVPPQARPIAHAATAALATSTRHPIPPAVAWLLALGSFLGVTGLAWDIQWHTDVGPDTFFTLPHLVIYSSSAVVGLPCLAVSLRILREQRAEGRLSLAPIPVPVLLAGFGTAMFVVSGLWDQWWHTVYGFDVTILSPPHIALLSCVTFSMVGAVAAFVSRSYGGTGRTQRFGSRALGVAVVAALLAAYGSLVFSVLATLVPTGGLDIDPVRVYLTASFVVVMTLAAAATRAPFTATAVGAAVVGLKLLYGWFAIAGTDWYAASLGLFVRDDVLAEGRRVAGFADGLPAVALLAGLLIDLVLVVGARRRWPARAVVAAAGAASSALLTVLFFHGGELFPGGQGAMQAPSPLTVVVSVVVGAVLALGGWQLGNLLRSLR
ncbi:MAG: hypothetical protein ACRCSN_20800 [Dermatophilaceae bacterium]